MPGIKASHEEITDGTEAALAEAISQLDAVDGTSVAGLLDAYLDVAVSSRSSHDWDPQGRIDAAVSTRSSHQWDPNGYIDQAISAAGASQSDIKAGAQDALAEKISNLNAVDGTSVAGLLDAYLDAAISSRSSHDWDPQGRIDAAVSTRSSHQWDPDGVIPTSGTVARRSDTGDLGGTTAKIANVSAGGSVSVSGSGYLTGIGHGKSAFSNSNVKAEVTVDGTTLGEYGMADTNANAAASVPMLLRFTTGFTVSETKGSEPLLVAYALD